MADSNPSAPRIGTKAQWLAARETLLAEEKAWLRQGDALAQRRRQLPWVPVAHDYQFAGPGGPVGLSDLFDGHSQLIVQHIMFHPDDDSACAICSFWADGYDPMVAHLAQRDTRLVAISRAPLPKIQAYQQRMGWHFDWLSSYDTSFNEDYHVSATDAELAAGQMYYNYHTHPIRSQEQHGTSCFAKDVDGNVYHTYSTYGRGLDPMNAAYAYLDLTAKGRNESGLPFSMAWVRRHDEY